MAVSYHFDEDVSLEIARLLQRSGRNVITYADLRMHGAPDYEHLIRAADADRVVVTNNRDDFVLLHGAWFRWSQAWGVAPHHSGILVLNHRLTPQQATQEIIALEGRNEPFEDHLYIWRSQAGWQIWSER